MVFSSRLGLFLVIVLSVVLLSLDKNKENYKVFIINGYAQCHDCPSEIGMYLNSIEVVPVMLFECFNSPIVNTQRQEELNLLYENKFKYELRCDSILFQSFKEVENYPFLIKIFNNDTTVIGYDEIFSGKGNSLNKKSLKQRILND